MTTGGLRAFVLQGSDALAALEWLYIHSDVRGVHETDRSLTVYVAGTVPTLPFADVSAHEVAIADASPTGLENDTAITVAEDLVVRPPWIERPAGFHGIDLVVPRGNAFGSGEHDSTQLALRGLHALWNAPTSFADIGTGSGILALYARARGCAELQACDIDGPAVEAARALLPGADVRLGGPRALRPADCVAANLTGTELHRALSAIVALWNRSGPLVLSGMREHEVAGIRSRLPLAPDYVESRGAFTALGVVGSGVR